MYVILYCIYICVIYIIYMPVYIYGYENNDNKRAYGQGKPGKLPMISPYDGRRNSMRRRSSSLRMLPPVQDLRLQVSV